MIYGELAQKEATEKKEMQKFQRDDDRWMTIEEFMELTRDD